jgi:hypothetical protein
MLRDAALPVNGDINVALRKKGLRYEHPTREYQVLS